MVASGVLVDTADTVVEASDFVVTACEFISSAVMVFAVVSIGASDGVIFDVVEAIDSTNAVGANLSCSILVLHIDS